MMQKREIDVLHDVEYVAENYPMLGGDSTKISEYLQYARESVHADPGVPIRFHPRMETFVEIPYADTTQEVIALASQLIRIPSVTACPDERLNEVRRAATWIYDYSRYRGLEVQYFYQDKYPALLISFPDQAQAPVMLAGHFDVVAPEPDDSQFEPVIEGDYLWGRGSADMKTVVATYLVWMKEMLDQGPPYPPINLLLVGNEENGETDAMGTPQLLRLLAEESNYQPELLIAGERTGEHGDELWGEICIENRGLMRFDIAGYGERSHPGVRGASRDLTEAILATKADIHTILEKYLTLHNSDGWQSQVKYPFIQVGTPGIFNISPDTGVLGVEVRPIPQDNLTPLKAELDEYCVAQKLELRILAMENGIACDLTNPNLQTLIQVVNDLSGESPRLGRKLPGTSARFAPGGQAIVWGQTGLNPHARSERHYIPSIKPYYQALTEFGKRLVDKIDRA
jgi:succinyl-diaminopimelate desuccinylase